MEVNEENFEKETDTDLVVVDFYAPWCAPCRTLGPILDQLENIKVVKVNVDDNKALAAQYKVSSIPKLVFLKNGTEVFSCLGVKTKDVLQKIVDDLLDDMS
jgi:thioredoxin 1